MTLLVKRFLTLLLLVLITGLFTLLSNAFFVFRAQAELQDCDTAPTQEKKERCEELKDQLGDIQESLKKEKKQLAEQEVKSDNLSSAISTLENKIRKHEISIQARRKAIQQLSGNIEENEERIEVLSEKIQKSQSALAELLRRTDVKDRYSLVEVVLKSKNFSDFYTDIDQMQSVNASLHKKLQVIEEARILTKGHKEKLVAQRVSEQQLKEVQLEEKQQIAQNQDNKEVLLSHSKTQEQFHKHVIAQRKQEAAQIRAALFQLRDANTSISFGRAYEIAKQVEAATGIRPAFLLAILTQESNIGKNVGRCNIPSTPNRMWRDIMPGPNDNSWRNDQAAYLEIMNGLGLDPTDKPLSCPLSSAGWGGAMGPSQFIPATWQMVASRIPTAGGSVPNPWDPHDAFFASGIYLSGLIAGPSTPATEIEEAGRYYAGGGWQTRGMVYARSVQRRADNMERKIKLLDKYDE